MTKQEYLESINKFDLLGRLSPDLKKAYVDAEPADYGVNLRMLELAKNDTATSKKSFMAESHQAAAVFEKESQTAKHGIAKKTETHVQSSDEAEAEKLLKKI